jgi:hypothetical protein
MSCDADHSHFSGRYLMTFLHGFVMMAAFCTYLRPGILTHCSQPSLRIDYVPVFFQTSKEATPIGSAVDTLGTALTVAPGGIATGVSIRILGLYRPQILIGWIFIVIGFGLFSMFNVNTTEAALQGYQVLMGIGFGMEMTSTQYPILASVGIEDVAPSLALFMFVRSFAQVRYFDQLFSWRLSSYATSRLGESQSGARFFKTNYRNGYPSLSSSSYHLVYLSYTQRFPKSLQYPNPSGLKLK